MKKLSLLLSSLLLTTNLYSHSNDSKEEKTIISYTKDIIIPQKVDTLNYDIQILTKSSSKDISLGKAKKLKEKLLQILEDKEIKLKLINENTNRIGKNRYQEAGFQTRIYYKISSMNIDLLEKVVKNIDRSDMIFIKNKSFSISKNLQNKIKNEYVKLSIPMLLKEEEEMSSLIKGECKISNTNIAVPNNWRGPIMYTKMESLSVSMDSKKEQEEEQDIKVRVSITMGCKR